MHVFGQVIIGLLLSAAFVAQQLRWLRVLQREHYEPRSMVRFLGRWSSPPLASAKASRSARNKRPITPTHVALLFLLLGAFLSSDIILILTTVAYGLICPWGLSIKGRTSKLQWTRRLRVIAGLSTLLAIIVSCLGVVAPRHWLLGCLVVWAVPPLLDVTTRLLAPYERRNAQKFVDQAVKRLQRVRPRVIAITGSFGKTSTKNHLADLLRGDGGVVASPRSFNNRAGLSRTINENLADGTRVFIAEMGTYGPGEISELCSWCPPEIAVITAIGPVHLERMKSLEVISQAKFEITESATTVILNGDDPLLRNWIEPLRKAGKTVRLAGTQSNDLDVQIRTTSSSWTVLVHGEEVATIAPLTSVQPTNLACAVAAALEVGALTSELAQRLSQVTVVANRANVVLAPSGVLVIDDTFNANPASAASALALLRSQELTGKRYVVTPGLIELGPTQWTENLKLARSVEASGAQLVIVGRTNARALENGFDGPVQRFDTRDEAVAWVREVLIAGDGVLYLNDLPDHYP